MSALRSPHTILILVTHVDYKQTSEIKNQNPKPLRMSVSISGVGRFYAKWFCTSDQMEIY